MTAMQRLAIIDRGEPAMRCISAVAELNLQSREQITTIALYLQDTASSIVREADEAVALSPAASAGTGRQHSTRLDPARVLAALTEVRADALWAGWEFIADPAELARLCERAGITFIGPGSDVIRLLDDKARTRQLAESIGIPVVPWPGVPAGRLRLARLRATWKSRWWPMASARCGLSASAMAASGSGISRSSSSRPARRSTRPPSRRCMKRPSGCALPSATAAPRRSSSASIRRRGNSCSRTSMSSHSPGTWSPN